MYEIRSREPKRSHTAHPSSHDYRMQREHITYYEGKPHDKSSSLSYAGYGSEMEHRGRRKIDPIDSCQEPPYATRQKRLESSREPFSGRRHNSFESVDGCREPFDESRQNTRDSYHSGSTSSRSAMRKTRDTNGTNLTTTLPSNKGYTPTFGPITDRHQQSRHASAALQQNQTRQGRSSFSSLSRPNTGGCHNQLEPHTRCKEPYTNRASLNPESYKEPLYGQATRFEFSHYSRPVYTGPIQPPPPQHMARPMATHNGNGSICQPVAYLPFTPPYQPGPNLPITPQPREPITYQHVSHQPVTYQQRQPDIPYVGSPYTPPYVSTSTNQRQPLEAAQYKEIHPSNIYPRQLDAYQDNFTPDDVTSWTPDDTRQKQAAKSKMRRKDRQKLLEEVMRELPDTVEALDDLLDEILQLEPDEEDGNTYDVQSEDVYGDQDIAQSADTSDIDQITSTPDLDVGQSLCDTGQSVGFDNLDVGQSLCDTGQSVGFDNFDFAADAFAVTDVPDFSALDGVGSADCCIM